VRSGPTVWEYRQIVLSFVYLAFAALLRLLIGGRRSEFAKDVELLVLRHQLVVLRRQQPRPRFQAADRAFLAALTRMLPHRRLRGLIVTPQTLLRWHRELVRRKWAELQRSHGRPPVERRVRELVLRLARENPRWGYPRIAGELLKLGVRVSPNTVRRLLLAAGRGAAGRAGREFLRQQAASVLACDFFTVETISPRRYYVLFFIELGSRRVRLAGCTTNPSGAWVTQQARNLSFTGLLERTRFLIHDRDSKFSAAFDEVFRSEGIKVIHTPIRAPSGERPREAVRAHRPRRVSRLAADSRPPPPRPCAPPLREPLQRRAAAPSTRAPLTRRQRQAQRARSDHGSSVTTSSADSSTSTEPLHEHGFETPHAIAATAAATTQH
jgi:putative transposase